MSALFLAVFISAAPCTRVVVTPFEPLATTPAAARAFEEEVRTALASRPGLCVEPRAATVAKLAKFERHRLPPCAELACLTAQLAALESDEVLSGVVVGAGARSNVDLLRSTSSRTARTTAAQPELTTALGLLYQWDAQERPAPKRWPSILLGSAGVASAGVGVAVGLEAKRHEQALSTGTTGCPSGGNGYRDCFEEQLRTGKAEATAANVLFGVAGALAAGAIVFWVVDLP